MLLVVQPDILTCRRLDVQREFEMRSPAPTAGSSAPQAPRTV